jgi:hypothetical protein
VRKKEARKGLCFYCGKPANTADHVIPRSIVGFMEVEDTYQNYVGACHYCNTDKAQMTMEEYRTYRTVRHLLAMSPAVCVSNIVSLVIDHKFYGEMHPETQGKQYETLVKEHLVVAQQRPSSLQFIKRGNNT